ncbi:MAG: DUF4331 family protein [Bacteroidota bacterium]
MKKVKITAILLGCAFTVAGIIYAADHIDSPNVTGNSSDITDLYVFQGENKNNMVFVANTQGLLSPGSTGAAKFNENTLIQFSIDNNGDNIEDLVLQAKYDAASTKMNVYGPIKPSTTGTQSIIEGRQTATVQVTEYGSAPKVGTVSGISVFAGPRDDPFFFDLSAFKAIIGGTATAFKNPGVDAFAGTNVLSVVIEVPKSMLGAPASGAISVWATTRTKI